MAITDHGALYGAVAFYQAARTKGIKPIIGVETYVARRSMTDKEGKADAQPFHLILLAQDLVGYRNLCRLVTDAHIDGYYYKPRIDRDHLARHSEGLIGLSSCLSGEIPKALEVEDWELARNLAGEYGDIFGKDRFYLELQDHGMPDQRRLNEQLLRLAPEAGLPLVVTNDLHYVREDQSEAHDVLLCVGTGNNLDTPNRMRFDTHEFYVKSAAQMAALFPDHPEAIANTRRIAEMTDLSLPLGQLRIPHFPVPDGYTVETLAARGVPARPRAPLRDGHPGAPGAARLRARRHPDDGLRRLLPDRGRLHRVRPRAGHPDDLPRLGARLDRDLHAGHHPGRPDPLPAAVRALPQPRPGDDARHRRRLRGRPARGGHRLRRAQVRPGPRGPDHHLRHDAGAGGHPRRRPRPRPLVRRGRPDRQGRPEPARHPARRGDRQLGRAARHGPGRPGGQADHRFRAPPRGRRPQRLDPRRRGGHQPRAADRAHAAPEGDQLGRADEPVRDARDRGARACSSSTSWASRT